ncbi:two-component system sensor histidine kinase NtrB [Pedosphaera parvula]|uniref:histidine kinase n=1 Tax=Pedosphaera parvula (strain Ellin514) TaxID=320771 RepID=B9XPI7_PEDPL|nr:ATP-binding protein [Pedosphaera parvula]EEF58215.1 multi-sensor signal transduction histidine kinase [Pedosphaera parvula Ellin514]
MSNITSLADTLPARIAELFKEQQQSIVKHTDLIFARLMMCQWIFGVALALWISPRTWTGTVSQTHLHVWAAVLLGGAITSVPVLLGLTQPGKTMTRHAIGVGQMLMSALLIHLTGGRIETHFHVFGSLAILAFYRDWKVLISASAVVYLDHVLRGIFWPQSVYGVLSAPIWRSLEHAGWVVFEVTFLIISIRKSLSEMLLVAERQARLESLKEGIEQTVAERTADLTRENTERRQAEDQLRRSQAQLAQAQQIAHMGSWEWDLVENKVTFSEETQRLYGRKPEESGSSMESCMKQVHPDDLPRVNKIMAEALRNRQSFVCDHRVVLPGGTERIMQGRGELLLNSQGEPIRMFGIVQDITEAKRAAEALHRSEEQLRQSQKMEAVGRLAGGVAHDFNNLLTVIGGYCALSLRQIDEAHPLQKSIAEIQKASERAASLTSQLLAFSRKQVLQPRVLQLNEVVRGMEKMLRRLIGEDIELSTAFDLLLGHVKADPGQIEQVIMNLAVNARDAMPRGGKLTISTANITIDQKTHFRNRTLDVGDYVQIALSDNGVGMTEEVKSHLFEPFFTTKGLGKGTGLGLATCYGIICQSNGDIRVYSEPNSGTTFKIYLPRTDAKLEPTANPESGRLPSGYGIHTRGGGRCGSAQTRGHHTARARLPGAGIQQRL